MKFIFPTFLGDYLKVESNNKSMSDSPVLTNIQMKCIISAIVLLNKLNEMIPGVQTLAGNFMNSVYNTVSINPKKVPHASGDNNEFMFLLPLLYTGDTEKDIHFIKGILYNCVKTFIRALIPANLHDKESFSFTINNDDELSFYMGFLDNLLIDTCILIFSIEKIFSEDKDKLKNQHEEGETVVVPFPPRFTNTNGDLKCDPIIHFHNGPKGWTRGADGPNATPKMQMKVVNLPSMTNSTTQLYLVPRENRNLFGFKENVSLGTARIIFFSIYSEYWGINVDEFYRKHITHEDKEDSLEACLHVLKEKFNIPN